MTKFKIKSDFRLILVQFKEGTKMHTFCQNVKVFWRDQTIYSNYKGIQIEEAQISRSLLY